MTLELLTEFDLFLSAEHICHYSKIGSGNTSNLSSQTYGEFVQIMVEQITKQIVEEVKFSKYFSISIDSTPDVSHVDQLSFIIRYLIKDGTPVERFLKFIANTGHKSEQIADAIFDTFNQYNLNIKNCRGQYYDKASNMSGKYTSFQPRIKEVIPLAIMFLVQHILYILWEYLLRIAVKNRQHILDFYKNYTTFSHHLPIVGTFEYFI
jgi:hypothetical protein